MTPAMLEAVWPIDLLATLTSSGFPYALWPKSIALPARDGQAPAAPATCAVAGRIEAGIAHATRTPIKVPQS